MLQSKILQFIEFSGIKSYWTNLLISKKCYPPWMITFIGVIVFFESNFNLDLAFDNNKFYLRGTGRAAGYCHIFWLVQWVPIFSFAPQTDRRPDGEISEPTPSEPKITTPTATRKNISSAIASIVYVFWLEWIKIIISSVFIALV